MKRKIFIILLSLIALILICSCKKNSSIKGSTYNQAGINPLEDQKSSKVNIEFVELHNYVIDALKAELTPFFFIREGELDVSGDNEKKEIVLSFNCMDKTTEKDAELFVVWVTKLIGNGATEQYPKYKASTDSTYGDVFNDYSFVIDGKLEGKPFMSYKIDAGGDMPFDARYVKDLNSDE